MNRLKSVNKFSLSFSLVLGGFFLIASLHEAIAQKKQNCEQAFEQAQRDYKNGKVFKVLELENCVNNLPAYLQDEAYYLLFNSYVHTQQDSMALISMQHLLRENPNIDPKNEDEKFRYFYQRFQAKPSEIGLMVGQNMHRGTVPSSKYNKGFSLGLVHNKMLNRKLALFKNFIYSERHQILKRKTGKYNLQGTYIGQNNISKETAQTYGVNAQQYPTEVFHLSGDTYPSFLEFASGLQWNVLTKGHFQVFILGGLAVNYLIETSFDNGEVYAWPIDYTDNNGMLEANFPLETPISLVEAQDAEHKTDFNLNYLGGFGIRYHINDGVLFIESRLQQSVFQQEVAFESLTTDFNEVLSPFDKRSLKFQTRTLTFSFGYLFSIQRFKSLR